MVKKGKNGVQQTTTFQYVAILVFLSVLNIVFFFSHGFSYTKIACTTDVLLAAVARYLDANGIVPIETCMPEQCLKPSGVAVRTFENAVRNMVLECSERPYIVSEQAILTLITTFDGHNHADSEKIIVHNNTIRNWSRLKPRVNLILFSNDTYWTKVAKGHGWDVVPVQISNASHPDRPPVLKEMFAKAKSKYNTLWYGYVNADILFTSDLLEHLDMLNYNHNASERSILLTGRRTNVENVSLIDPLSDDNLMDMAEAQGVLYKEDAEDFFIATKLFPWDKILPVVVGRPAYDNWLVAEARCRLKADVIDVTETLLALHQTTVKGGNLEGHSHKENDINFQIFKQNKLSPNFLAGLTPCITFNTFFTLCDKIGVTRRTEFGAMCKCGK